MLSETYTELGKIQISHEVIATVAGIVVAESFGLVGMAPQRITDGFVELLGQENPGRGVEVRIDGDKVFITLHVIVHYGVRISEVARNAMERVRYAVQEVTGLNVERVDVDVHGVRVDTARSGGQQ